VTQADYDILDMISDEEGHFVLGALPEPTPEESPAQHEPPTPPMVFELDAPATIAVASFGAGLLLGFLFRRRF